MRIRKHASKLLGSATIVFSAPPPPPAAAAAAGAGVEGVLCELNCSPWDVMMLPEDGHANPKEEKQGKEDGGILGNVITPEKKSKTAITNYRKIEEKGGEDEFMDQKKEKKARKKTKEIEILAATPNCKKSDGKGWRCKRPAHPNHSLCHYHLTQFRSYRLSNRTHSNNDVSKTSEFEEGGVGSSEFYYYYSGFGPSRVKRRIGANVRVQEEEEEEGEGLAGDDEYDSESLDGGEEGDYGIDDRYLVKDLKGGGGEEKKHGKVLLIKKRGRKPVKARSLKSLL